MKTFLALIVAGLGATVSLGPTPAGAGKETAVFPRFRMKEIYKGFEVGYAVKLVDVNGDGKPDIVVVDSKRVVWHENPTWKMRTIIKGQTQPDNVCIAAFDIDGDDQIDFALGAGWNPGNTLAGGTPPWLKRRHTLDQERA